MEKPTDKTDFDELKNQIDYLEAKLRSAELEANARLEEAAPIQTLYKWRAPERIFAPKNRSWYVSVAFVVIIIVAYSALTANYLLILALIVLLILLYALNTFPPKVIEHEITNKGIKTFDKIFTWNKIENFWVSRRSNQYLLNIDLLDGSVKRMILLVGDGDANKIVQELVKRVDYINPGGTRQDFLSKLTEGRHVPLTEFLDVFEESRKKGIELEKPTQKT
jgi:hypothetical protein